MKLLVLLIFVNSVDKMLKLFLVILGLAFLVIETYSTIILEKLCGRSTDALETSFYSTDSLQLGECTFELIVRPETCGIRIDFETFSFNQPIKLDNTSAYMCGSNLDLLKLTALGLPLLDLSVLCGELSGHHINLPTRDYSGELLLDLPVTKKLILNVVHTLILGAQKPSWNITLTQLPCNPGCAKKAKKPKYNLAPAGCLQYHVEKEGIIESLNFLNGLGHYLGDLNYAICFKRYPDTCGIRFSAIDFELASNGNSSCFTERDCDTLSLLDITAGLSILANKDYLIIPDGVSVNAGLEVFASKYCGKSLKQLQVSVVTHGPLYLGVVTDGRSNLNDLEIGFKIKYELLTNCKILN